MFYCCGQAWSDRQHVAENRTLPTLKPAPGPIHGSARAITILQGTSIISGLRRFDDKLSQDIVGTGRDFSSTVAILEPRIPSGRSRQTLTRDEILRERARLYENYLFYRKPRILSGFSTFGGKLSQGTRYRETLRELPILQGANDSISPQWRRKPRYWSSL
ncbi:hypothetical protein BaRGS_00035905 [Batillaria attramentaria]|uniref:Uncharacterized protein n=1 Tax=Batillaria attramentaria TaxID=370345 RepID=A0ABD0JDC2_9CAEN